MTPDPAEAATEQGPVCDEEDCAPDAPVVDGRCGWCGEPRGEWQQMGYTEDRIVLDVDQLRRTVDAIEATGRFADELADRVAARTRDGLTVDDIAAKRAVPVPGRYTFHLPEQLGGLREDTPEAQRFRANRADRRRLARGMRRG